MLWMFLIVYFALMALMYVFQRSFVFAPSMDDPFITERAPFQIFTYKTPLGLNLRGLYVAAQNGKPTIVYFHGNAGNVADRIHKAMEFIPNGYGVALVGYRGYSGNPGQPSEKNLYEDARSAIAMLQTLGVRKTDMIIYGESLGTGVATQMATEFPTKALILEAPFTSLVDVGARRYWFFPVRFLMKDKFHNARKIGALKMPILIIHGTRDETVPYKLGERLFGYVTSPVKEFLTLNDASHADVYDFGAGKAINDFLSKI